MPVTADAVQQLLEHHATWRAERTNLCPYDQPEAALATTIEHTLLKPFATQQDIKRLCDQAKAHRLGAVCVNPVWVGVCERTLADSGVLVATVCGFPTGATTTQAKAYEAKVCAEDGADEVDMVAQIGLARGGEWSAYEDDVAAVVEAAGSARVKVILECCDLTDEEKARCALLCVEAGAAFVKTSTGFGSGGATVEDVALLRLAAGARAGVKAAGGIRSREDALAMLAAGADRLGTSGGIQIVAP